MIKTMKSEQEIRDRLRELHGEYIPREAGGTLKWGEAKGLAWSLGSDEGAIQCVNHLLDVSGIVEVEE